MPPIRALARGDEIQMFSKRNMTRAALVAGVAMMGLTVGYRNSKAGASPPMHSTVAANADRVLTAADALPLEETRHQFNDLISGQTHAMRLSRTDSDQAFPWRLRLGDRIDHLGQDDHGQIVIGRSEDLHHEALILFDPPLPLMRNMQPGQQLSVRSKMTVLDRNDPTQVKDRGTCTLRMTYVAIQKIKTPAGFREAFALKRQFKASLSVATVTSNMDQWFAPGVGLIAEQSHETVKAFLPLWTTEQKLVLAD